MSMSFTVTIGAGIFCIIRSGSAAPVDIEVAAPDVMAAEPVGLIIGVSGDAIRAVVSLVTGATDVNRTELLALLLSLGNPDFTAHIFFIAFIPAAVAIPAAIAPPIGPSSGVA